MVAPDKAEKLLKEYRGILFPEEYLDDIKYMKKAQDIFKKLREFTFRVKPIG